LAVIESSYFGCSVFATPYGSLPELVNNEVGFLSASADDLSNALNNAADFDKQKCHEYALNNFSSKLMALNYLTCYERVINGEVLNKQIPTLKQPPESKYLPYG